jgi:hypothetical protein
LALIYQSKPLPPSKLLTTLYVARTSWSRVSAMPRPCSRATPVPAASLDPMPFVAGAVAGIAAHCSSVAPRSCSLAAPAHTALLTRTPSCRHLPLLCCWRRGRLVSRRMREAQAVGRAPSPDELDLSGLHNLQVGGVTVTAVTLVCQLHLAGRFSQAPLRVLLALQLHFTAVTDKSALCACHSLRYKALSTPALHYM